jgi:hypothetical protein
MIADALYAPEGVGQAVVSVLDKMGISIVGPDGTVLRAASGTPAASLTLTEDEVRGLIAMGTRDAATIVPGMPGGSPYTFADLQAALAPVLRGVSVDNLAARYARAYEEHPDTLLGAIFGAQPIRPDLALTRVHLWLLFVDGFVHGTAGASRNPGAAVVPARASGPGWGTADPYLPNLVSPDPRLSDLGFALMLAHLPMLGFGVPIDSQPLVASAHEGHGGPGQAVPMTARVGVPGAVGLVDPITGAPLFLPTGRAADGIAVRWSSDDTSVIGDHGALDRALDAPVETDALGTAGLQFLPKEEVANGQGDEVTAVATLRVTVGLRDLVAHFYQVTPAMSAFLFGDRTTPAVLQIGWHEPAGLRVELTNIHNVKVEPYVQAFLPAFDGKAQRTGVDSATGFLARQPDGTYRGTLRARVDVYAVHMAFASAKCDFDGGGQAAASSGQWLQVVGRPITTSMWKGYDLDIWRRVLSGTPDSEAIQLSFYPASPPRAWSIWCLTPIQRDGGGAPGASSSTYAPFNDLAWTDPGVGYQIFTPKQGSVSYVDYRGTLNPYEAASRGDVKDGSVWLATVTRTGAAP